MSNFVKHIGGCHCGAVTFEGFAAADIKALRCNCSICSMTGFIHLLVDKSNFTLLTGEKSLSNYRFNTGIAQHKFCSICGVKPFYIHRSHPDGVSINVNCLHSATIDSLAITDFDGRNWEEAIHTLD